ncbi:MAG: hypothetical protein HPY59_18295 [Anaerolineae bacterium]|nr:hypothetical protein [Anaerolineae bacterium]
MGALKTLECPNCSAPLEDPSGGFRTIRCPFCGSLVVIPQEWRAKSERKDTSSSDTAYSFPSFSGLPPDIEGIIRNLVAAGNKLEAIRLYRESADSSLKDAKEAIDTLADSGVLQTRDVSKPQTGLTFQQSGVVYEVAQLVLQGEHGRAVDAYRRGFNASHAEAKAVVNELYKHQEDDPQKVVLETRQRVGSNLGVRLGILPVIFGGSGCAITVFVAFTFLFTVFIILFTLTLPGGPLHSLWSRIDPTAYANLVLSFGGEGNGPGLFTDARPIAISPAGDVYVGDFQDGRIQRFNEAGEFQNLWQIPKNQYIRKLVADRSGVVFALYAGEIWKYDGRTGKALGQVDNPQDYYYEDLAMTADGGWVAVKDSEDLLRFDGEWSEMWMVEDAVSSITDDSASGARLAVDGLGNIYLIATFNYAVFKYDPQGKYINRWGEEGDGPGQFKSLLAIAVDSYSRVFVSDFSGIHVFTAEGRLLDTIPLTGVAYGLAFDGENGFWLTSSSKKVQKYSIKYP